MQTQHTTNSRPRQDEPSAEKPLSRAPVKVIREGAIAASIWQREGTSGTFYDFTLSRSWKSDKTGKSGYSTNFIARNAEQLQKVITEASRYIAERQPASSSDELPS